MKFKLWKPIFVIVAWVILSFIQKSVTPLVTADMAVIQLEDSDVAYASFSGYMNFVKNYFWILYILPLLVYTKSITNLIKNK